MLMFPRGIGKLLWLFTAHKTKDRIHGCPTLPRWLLFSPMARRSQHNRRKAALKAQPAMPPPPPVTINVTQLNVSVFGGAKLDVLGMSSRLERPGGWTWGSGILSILKALVTLGKLV